MSFSLYGNHINNSSFCENLMTEGNPIIKLDFGNLSKPATLLIKKISDAIGGYAKPWQTKRVAEAEAEADIIKAQAQIKITNLQRRALARFIDEEAKKQNNIETITRKTIPQLEDSSKPEQMDEDWVTNFFDKCRIVSDEQMQTLWSRILAGEANTPGTFSKRTVNLLGSLDKQDAHLFTSLCGFVWAFEGLETFVFDEQASIYNNAGIHFIKLLHLDDIGIITFNPMTEFTVTKLTKRILLQYYGQPIIIEFKKEENNELAIGKVMLTKTGEQLARICGSTPVEGFIDYTLDNFVRQGLTVSSPYPRHQ